MLLEKGKEALIEEIRKHSPIPARLTKETYEYLHKNEINIDINQEVNINDAFDSGEAGGIVCAIEGDEKQVIIISLTHLIVKPDHPLSKKIADYQKKRIRRFHRYG